MTEPEETYTRGWRGNSGRRVLHHRELGYLVVYHDGSISWDELQSIKNDFWGADIPAIEVYPPQSAVINHVQARHLWRLGRHEWWPDMLGSNTPAHWSDQDDLAARYHQAWSKAWAA